MKTRIALTDANPEKRMEAIYNQFDKLGISSNPTLFRVSELSTSPTGSENHLSPLRFQTFNRKVF